MADLLQQAGITASSQQRRDYVVFHNRFFYVSRSTASADYLRCVGCGATAIRDVNTGHIRSGRVPHGPNCLVDLERFAQRAFVRDVSECFAAQSGITRQQAFLNTETRYEAQHRSQYFDYYVPLEAMRNPMYTRREARCCSTAC